MEKKEDSFDNIEREKDKRQQPSLEFCSVRRHPYSPSMIWEMVCMMVNFICQLAWAT
jgi:hypothetical protein